MNQETKKYFIEKMHETQKNFNALQLSIKDLREEIIKLPVRDDMPQGAPLSVLMNDESYDDSKDLGYGAIPMSDPVIYPETKTSEPSMRTNGDKGFPIICSNCGKNSFAPFEPRYASKVYCPDCYKSMNGKR